MGIIVGVMARAPAPGRCKTRLAPSLGDVGAATLYRAMLLDTLEGLERGLEDAARLVVMAAPEEDGVEAMRALAPPRWEVLAQRGVGLGERLTNASRQLGPAGDVVALVGSDSPTVDFRAIARALSGAKQPRHVLMGPCDDGGYYVIGMTSPEPGVFEGIDWSTSHVQRQTRGRCAALGLTLEELPPGYDVDDAKDLARLRAELRAVPAIAPRTAAVLGER